MVAQWRSLDDSGSLEWIQEDGAVLMCHFSWKLGSLVIHTTISLSLFVDDSPTRMETTPRSFSLDGSTANECSTFSAFEWYKNDHDSLLGRNVDKGN